MFFRNYPRDKLHGGFGSDDGDEQFLLRLPRQKNSRFRSHPCDVTAGNLHPCHADRVAAQ